MKRMSVLTILPHQLPSFLTDLNLTILKWPEHINKYWPISGFYPCLNFQAEILFQFSCYFTPGKFWACHMTPGNRLFYSGVTFKNSVSTPNTPGIFWFLPESTCIPGGFHLKNSYRYSCSPVYHSSINY